MFDLHKSIISVIIHSKFHVKVHQVCKTVSEFSLEFRVQQTLAKKREAKERNKSRQKLHELMMRQEEGKRRWREDKEDKTFPICKIMIT